MISSFHFVWSKGTGSPSRNLSLVEEPPDCCPLSTPAQGHRIISWLEAVELYESIFQFGRTSPVGWQAVCGHMSHLVSILRRLLFNFSGQSSLYVKVDGDLGGVKNVRDKLRVGSAHPLQAWTFYWGLACKLLPVFLNCLMTLWRNIGRHLLLLLLHFKSGRIIDFAGERWKTTRISNHPFIEHLLWAGYCVKC